MTADRRGERRDRLLSLLDESDLDGLIVTHLPNVRYLTGFTGSSGIAVVLREETILFSDFRYRTQAEMEVGPAVRVEIVADDFWKRLWEVLGEFVGIKRIGYETARLTVGDAAKMEQADTRVQREPAGELVERLRQQKDSDELQAIREAAQLAGEALAALLPGIRVGQREIEVAARLEFELRSRGSEWHPFPTIVASGARSALPHAHTGDREIEAGDWLLLDFGAQVDGYCADITRTVVVGRSADDRQQTIYELVREAQQHAIRHLRAGMTGREADGLARSVIEARGFGDSFGHSLGHGLGLEVHEEPRLSRSNETALPRGAVVTVEPGVYVPGWGGVRIEDDVHITDDGAELLSDGDTELRELS